MPLVVHRSHRMERLVEALAAEVIKPGPFQQATVVVGSRGMERWLRHQLAAHNGICAQVDFPFPRQAIDDRLMLLDDLYLSAPWLRDPKALTARVLLALRKLRQLPEARDELATIERYIDSEQSSSPGGQAISAKELSLASEVADTLDALVRKRPDQASALLKSPPTGWFQRLLQDVLAEIDPLAARLQCWRELCSGARALTGGLHVFGLSALSGDDLTQLGMLAKMPGFTVTLYQLHPTPLSIADDPSEGAIFAQLKRQLRQGLVSSVAVSEHEATLALVRSQMNPLLASFGRLSADSERLLSGIVEALELEVDEPAHFDPAPGPGVLGQLQLGLLQADQPPKIPLADDDRSVTFHPCYGPTRQVELLRELLEHSFAASASPLRPRDVLVMTPDVETYGPLVEAVFSREPALPVQVSDLGYGADNPFAEALGALLDLAIDRVTLSGAMTLLEQPAVRHRFDLDSADVLRLTELLREAGARWGLDAEDRALANQPTSHLNTLDFAIERLVLGALSFDEASQAPAIGGPYTARAMDLSRPEERELIARGVHYLETLRWHLGRFREGDASAAEWVERLTEALEELTAPSKLSQLFDRAGWWWTRTVDAVDACLPEVDPLLLAIDAVRAALRARLLDNRAGDRPVAGAIAVCAMEPMRSVPFRVIALLGMDHGSFPRTERSRAWSPLAEHRRLGEHQRRDVDLHLMLEAVMSARERLMVLWTGRDPNQGQALPPAIPVSALREAVNATVEAPMTTERQAPDATERPSAADALTFGSTLHPWASDNFVAGATNYRPGASLSFDSPPGDARALAEPALSAGAVAAVALDTSALARALTNGPRTLLDRRVGVHRPWTAAKSDDREPFKLENKEQLVDELLARTETIAISDGAGDELRPRAIASGGLPHGGAGEGAWREILSDSKAILSREAEALAGGDVTPWSIERRTLVLPADEVSLSSGAINVAVVDFGQDQRGLVLNERSTKEMNGRSLLRGWLDLLVFAARDQDVPVLGLLWCSPKRLEWLQAPERGHAEALLVRLTRLWRACEREVMPLFPKTSGELAKLLRSLSARTKNAEAKNAGSNSEEAHTEDWAQRLDETTRAQINAWQALDSTERRAERGKLLNSFIGNDYVRFADLEDDAIRRWFDADDLERALPERGPADPLGWMEAALLVWGPALRAHMKVNPKQNNGFVRSMWGAR